jgi:hypothetical protein
MPLVIHHYATRSHEDFIKQAVAVDNHPRKVTYRV